MNRRDFFRTVAAGLAIPVASLVGGKVEPKAEFTLVSGDDSLGMYAYNPGYQWEIADGTLVEMPTKQEITAAVDDALADAFKSMAG